MARFSRAILAVVVAGAVACGGADPDVRHPDWEEHFNRANQATADGNHDQAIAIGEAYLKSHPGNADGHMMIADAAAAAGKAATGATRAPRFEQAASHYASVVEMSKNPIRRTLSLVESIEVYSARGLNQPDNAERFARLLIAEDPADFKNYQALVNVLKEARKFDGVAATFQQARSAIGDDAETVSTYGGLAHDVVAFTPDFPRDSGRRLLADAAALTAKALSVHGNGESLLRTKGMLLRAQAGLEPDAARQRALSEESQRTFAELDRLNK
jgi:tetratricopeptide (TPR) repeat protein